MRLALASLAFVVLCSAQNLPINFGINDPVTSAQARVWVSPQNWKSVTATIENRIFALQLTPESVLGAYDWAGWVDLSGLAFGNYDLVITATDFDDHTYTATKTIIYDIPPVLDVKLPLTESVATPLLPFEASCSHPDDCRIALLVGEAPVPHTAKLMDLSAYDHSTVNLHIYAIDSLGVKSQEQVRTIYVESNPRLRRVAEAPGPIVDFDSTRVLFERQVPVNTVDQQELAILTQVDGAISSVTMGKLLDNSEFLTPKGAVYAEWNAAQGAWALIDYPYGGLGSMAPYSLKVSGNYLLWKSDYYTYLRDTIEGVTISVPDASQGVDVSPQGVVSRSDGLHIYLNGKLISSQYWNRNPVTDGSSVVWERELPGYPSGQEFIVFSDGGSDTYLSKARVSVPQPKVDYQIAGGWVAYTDIGPVGQIQIWLRNPSGIQMQLSNSATDCTLESISDHGEVLYTSMGRMHFNQNDLGLMIGHPIWREGHCFSSLGRELFQLDLGMNSPLSIGLFGDQVVLRGSGRLQISVDLVHWSEIAALDGILHLNTPASQVFYRLSR